MPLPGPNFSETLPSLRWPDFCATTVDVFFDTCEIESSKNIIDSQKSDIESMHDALRDRSTNEKKITQQINVAKKAAKKVSK